MHWLPWPPQFHTAHTAGAQSLFSPGPARLIASKMHKKEKRNVAGGQGAVGLAGVQLRHSISCLPSLMQTSLCPRQSVHPLPSLPGSLPSTRALDEPDIWHGWTQCASAGEPGRTRQRCAASSPSFGMKGAPRCRLPPAPLPSLWEQLPLSPGPHRSGPMTDIFPCTEARQLPLQKAALPQMCSVSRFSLLLIPVPPAAAPPATSLLEGCLRGRRWCRLSLSLCHCCWQPPGSCRREGTCCGPALPGHCLSPCQTGLVALGRVDAKPVPPAQTCHQRDPAAHPQSFRQDRAGTVPKPPGSAHLPGKGHTAGLTLLSLITP